MQVFRENFFPKRKNPIPSLQVLQSEYNGRMAAKLGIKLYDRDLVVDLMKAMYEDEADFTNTFR